MSGIFFEYHDAQGNSLKQQDPSGNAKWDISDSRCWNNRAVTAAGFRFGGPGSC